MIKLNPYAKTLKRRRIVSGLKLKQSKIAAQEAKKKGVKIIKKKKQIPKNKEFIKRLLAM